MTNSSRPDLSLPTLTDDDLASIGAPDGSPRRAGLVGEIGTALQPWRLAFKSRALRSAPKGNGRIAIALPGWKAPEVTTAPLRGYLRSIGHDAQGWGFGINQGDVEAKRDDMVVKVRALAERSGRPVNLLGWSLGGVVAREVARTAPESVHRLVIYGSPVVGGPTHTAGVGTYAVDEVTRTPRASSAPGPDRAGHHADHRDLHSQRLGRGLARMHRPVLARRHHRRSRLDPRRPRHRPRRLAHHRRSLGRTRRRLTIAPVAAVPSRADWRAATIEMSGPAAGAPATEHGVAACSSRPERGRRRAATMDASAERFEEHRCLLGDLRRAPRSRSDR